MNSASTRVALVFAPERMNVYLRFGRPLRERRIDPRRRVAEFAPGSIFCRMRWEDDAYGTTCWQLCILQALPPGDVVQRVSGIVPGAALLLLADRAPTVHAVLRIIDAIEALGIDAANVPASYWRMLHNRIAARATVAPYTPERHAAQQAARGLA